MKHVKLFEEFSTENRSKSDELAVLFSDSIDKVEENLSYKDFANAIAIVLQENYGSHNFDPFMKELHIALGMNEDYTPDGSKFSRDSDKFDASASDITKLVHSTIYDAYEGHGPITDKAIQIIDDAAESLVQKLQDSGWITNTTQIAKKSGIV